MDSVRIIEIKESVFADNDREADRVRAKLKEEKTFLLNLMSSPGSGKTTTLLRTIERLKDDLRIGVMEADIDSSVDAETIARAGVKSIQLHTGGMCHLDAGEYAAGGRVLAALSRAGVKSLSATIVTHPHSDHYGGMRTVLEKLPAAAFYTAAVPESQLPTAQSYEKLLSTLSEQAIPAAYLFAGDTLPLGDAAVTVLSPARGATWENLNNYSLVLRVTYGNAAFLLMGDAEAEVEETILAAKTELAADVLVVGHHGSATSSSENFLKAVAPRYAILSVGEDNSYNLPNTGVLTRLKEQGAALYRTDLQGTVTVTSDGENLTITTAK